MKTKVTVTGITEEGGDRQEQMYALLEDFAVVFFNFLIIYKYCRIYWSTGYYSIRWSITELSVTANLLPRKKLI